MVETALILLTDLTAAAQKTIMALDVNGVRICIFINILSRILNSGLVDQKLEYCRSFEMLFTTCFECFIGQC